MERPIRLWFQHRVARVRRVLGGDRGRCGSAGVLRPVRRDLRGRRLLPVYSLVVPRRRAALYAVTTKRVVRVIEERSGERVDTALLQTIPNISVTPTKRGHGTILFGNRAVARWQSMAGNPWARDQIDETIEFVNIPEPSAVARLVGSLQSHGSV